LSNTHVDRKHHDKGLVPEVDHSKETVWCSS
jgi:hypothetical protein